MAILITRPAAQSHNLIRLLENEGYKVIAFPTIEIIVIAAQKIREIVEKLQADIVIFTSANAVHPVMPFWSAIKNQPQIFAVGAATATALQRYHINAIYPDKKFKSEGLLELAQLQTLSNKKIAIFTGKNSRSYLGEQLITRGANLELFEVYQRHCPEKNIDDYWKIWEPQLEMIVCTSKEGLHNLWKMTKTLATKQWLLKQKLLVISVEMLELATKLGFKVPPILAENPTDLTIVNAIKHVESLKLKPGKPIK